MNTGGVHRAQMARWVERVQEEEEEEEEGVQEVELEKPAVEAGRPAGRAAHGSRRTAREGEGGGGGGDRKRRSILSELGSYPRGRRTGLARGEGDRGREGGRESQRRKAVRAK